MSPAASSIATSTTAVTSSTAPTATPRARAKRFSARFIADAKLRDRVVLATKFTFAAQEGNPNAGGNGRKNIYRALEGSLRRLATDYVDLYWMHVWDMVTPVEEVVEHTERRWCAREKFVTTASPMFRRGISRARYLGASSRARRRRSRFNWNTRWWSAASSASTFLRRANSDSASAPGARWPADSFPANTRAKVATSSKGSRLEVLKASNNPVFNKFTEQNWKVLDAVQEVATQLGRSPARSR